VTGDVIVIGSPVYAGRLPPAMVERLRRIDGCGKPAVVVVVYGNRAYEDALLELAEVAASAGFVPVAAAAFIGEHSYSTPGLPIAQGRPDAADLDEAGRFGAAVADRIRGGSTGVLDTPFALPGNHPFRDLREPLGVAPALDGALCHACGACVAACPTGAIGPEGGEANGERCIQCCACVKTCPAGARRTEDPRVLQIAQRLNRTCADRKGPEVFYRW